MSASDFQVLSKKAKNLSLQRDRIQMARVLNEFISSSPNTLEKQKAIRLLTRLTEIFYTNKAQQDYEIAVTKIKNEPEVAEERLLDALKIEPQNAKLVASLLYVRLVQKKCDGSKSWVTKLASWNPYSENHKNLVLKMTSCSGNSGDWAQLLETLPVSKDHPELSIGAAQLSLLEGELESATSLLEKVNDESISKNYLLGSIGKQLQTTDFTRYFQRYADLCRSLQKSYDSRTHQLDLNYRDCLEVETVEKAYDIKGRVMIKKVVK
ncbi:MAG: hypothetical protein AB8E15_11090 [Bdellovibrionales bacterium]